MQKPIDLIGVQLIPTPLPTRARRSNYLSIIQQFREQNIESAIVKIENKTYVTVYNGLKSATYQYKIKDVKAHTRANEVYLTKTHIGDHNE